MEQQAEQQRTAEEDEEPGEAVQEQDAQPGAAATGAPGARDGADSRFLPVPAQAVPVWRWESVLGTLVLAGVLLTLSHAPFVPTSWRPWRVPALALLVAGMLLETLVLIPLRYRSYRYALLSDCLVLLRGRFFTKRSTFPLDQVLYVETRQGPVLRRYGLFSIRIGTIAEPHSFGPLDRAAVQRLQAAVETRTQVHPPSRTHHGSQDPPGAQEGRRPPVEPRPPAR